MSITRIDHVGILAGELEDGRHVFGDGWGLSVDEHRSPWPEGRSGTFDDVTSIEMPIGEMYIEISKPNDPNSPAGKFVEERRAGLYYISFASNDIKTDVAALQTKGVKLDGAWDGTSPVMLDPDSTLGIRIQITPEEHYFAHPFYKGNGLLQGMAHIGLAARNAEEVRGLWGDIFGFREDKTMERGQDGPSEDRDLSRAASDPVHLLEYPVGGSVIEISIPTTPDSGTAKLVAQRAAQGATFHHICPFAFDTHQAVDDGKAAGLQQIGSIPPREETKQVVAWFHPRTCVGTLIEIWNRPAGGAHHEHGTHPGPGND